MSFFRRLSSRGLAVLLAAIGAIGAGAAVVAVTAFGGAGATPPAEPLSQAIHDALSAAPVDGVTARISFEDNLLGSSALGSLPGGSPLLTGASGRLWLTSDGHLRLELQSDAGDAQIVSDGTTLTVYDGSSNTAYRLALPAHPDSPTTDSGRVSIPQIDSALARLADFANLSGATPDSVAGQAAYTVSASPKSNGGLLDSATLSWDATTGAPLRAAVYGKGDRTPVLELRADEISYGPVPASVVDISPPAGAKIVTLTAPTPPAGTQTAQPPPAEAPPVTGVDAVAAAVPFKLEAPDTLGGLARSDVRLLDSHGEQSALVTYGEGLGTVAVHERAAGPTGEARSSGEAQSSPLAQLPSVSINGATGHELATALGSIVEVTSGGVTYMVAGSVTRGDAEAAARALTS
jgi:outer membrane lipoprotein-sorting protein